MIADLKSVSKSPSPKDDSNGRLTVEIYIDIYLCIEEICGSDSQVDVRRSPSGEVRCNIIAQTEKRGRPCRFCLPNNTLAREYRGCIAEASAFANRAPSMHMNSHARSYEQD